MERGTPWDSEQSVSKCQHTQLWSQAPAKCDEKGEPLSYQSLTGLLYIRLKSLKCKRTYLTTANSFCSYLQEMQRKPRDTVVLQRAAGLDQSCRSHVVPEVPRQRYSVGAWAPEHMLSPGPRPEAALTENHHPRAGSANGHPSFSQVPTDVP